MPRQKKAPQVVFNDFTGVNNVQPQEKLKLGELREAVNVDVDDEGRIRRRTGHTQVYSGSRIHSFWSNGSSAYFVEADALKQLNVDFTASSLKTGLIPSQPMSFLDVQGSVYFADGYTQGIISGGTAADWGLSQPALPTVAPSPSMGQIAAGQYQITATVETSSGLESGAARGVAVTLDSGGGFSLSNIPNVSGTAFVNIYITPTDGDMFYLAKQVPTGTTATTITTIYGLGRQLRSQFMSPPPVGTLLELFKGRILTVVGNLVFYSEPFAYHWFRLDRNFLQFPSDVTMLAAVENGLYISSDKTYFVNGANPGDWSLNVVSDSPAILGTATKVVGSRVGLKTDDEVVLWTSHEGVFAGTAGGSLQNLTSGRFVPEPASRGTAVIRDRDGSDQYVALLKNTNDSPDGIYASDVAVAEVYRNGVLVVE